MDKNYFRVVKGDILQVHADALVYSANTKPRPAEYGLDLQVWQRAGIKNMLADRDGRVFEIGHLHVSKAFDLSDHFKWIFHIVTPLFMGGSYYEEDILCECYKKCLRKADELKLDSIAFPVLASGFLCFNMSFRINADNAFVRCVWNSTGGYKRDRTEAQKNGYHDSGTVKKQCGRL